MKTVTIHNKGPGMFSANLPHDVYCARSGRCHCAVTNHVTLKIDPETGEKSKGLKPRRVNGAIHVPAGKTLEGLHPFIKAIPEVKTAMKRGKIYFTEQVQEAPKKKPGKQALKPDVAVADQESVDASEPQSGKKGESGKAKKKKADPGTGGGK